MLPRWHIFAGVIFGALFFLTEPSTKPAHLFLAVMASIFIDVDHYLVAALRNKSLSFPQALKYYDNLLKKEQMENKQGIRVKGDFHIFHTLEFHCLVLFIGLAYSPFFYIFLGMLFHSLTDVGSLFYYDRFYRREYLFLNRIRRALKRESNQ